MEMETSPNIIFRKPFKFYIMARTRKRKCDVTGVTTSENNFYSNQSHTKAVDNLRRSTGATKNQMRRMFNQLTTY
jgi:hypothetical protein